MTRLEAINLALRSTGESNVATIVSSHPKIAVILATIGTVSKREQGKGRWFNTAVRTLEPIVGGGNAGKIDVSAYDAVMPVHRGADSLLFPRGTYLYDPTENTEVIGRSVQAKVRWLHPDTDEGWLLIPRVFTDYIAYASALEYASNYDADEQQLRLLKAGTDVAYARQNSDHIRYSRTNLFWSGSTGVALSNNYGDRYVVSRSSR